MSRFPATWLAALLIAVATLAAAPVASAQVTGGVGFRVDQAPGSTMEAGYMTITASAGTGASGYFFMTNSGTRGADLRVYPADGLTGVTTGVVYAAASAPRDGAGGWITPDTNGVSLGAQSERRVDFSVQVPPGTPAGDHVGSIVLEQNGAGSSTVSQLVRNVVPIRVVVPGGAGPQVMVRSAKIAALPGTKMPSVIVALRNMGAKMCAPTLTVSMRGPSEKGADVTRQLDMILPSDRAPYPLPWPRSIDQGSYLTKVTTSGCGASDSMTVTLDAPASFDDTPGAAGAPTSGKPPAVVTDAQPGESTYEDGPGSKRRSGSSTAERTARPRASADGDGDGDGGAGVTGAAGAGSGGSRGGDASGTAGKTPGDAAPADDKSGAEKLLSDIANAVGENAPAVIKRATVPLLLLLLVGLIFFVQEALDRKDPKLALAPLHREPHLSFDPDPLHTGGLVPLPVSPPLSQLGVR